MKSETKSLKTVTVGNGAKALAGMQDGRLRRRMFASSKTATRAGLRADTLPFWVCYDRVVEKFYVCV